MSYPSGRIVRVGEHGDINTARIIHGRPWKDAIISILDPRSPYRPWSGVERAEPGDALVMVLDTDPVSVLAAVGIVGADGEGEAAIAGIHPFYVNGLLELGTLNMLADFEVRPDRDTVYHHESPQKVVDVLGDYNPSSIDALFGHTSLAAGRVLLASRGQCAGCGRRLDLVAEDARDDVHIHTADRCAEDGPKWVPPDWPAALCDSCHTRMQHEGFTSFLDFRFSTHPRCPDCGAQHTMSAMYGMPAGPVEEPWIATMGCVITEPRTRWVCGDCRRKW